jgi:hypothetical protein
MLIKLEVLEQLEQRVLLFTLRHLLRHIPESPLILLVFLLHCREPRALTGLLPEWLCKSRKEAKWKLVRRWIYRFVVILQHRKANLG